MNKELAQRSLEEAFCAHVSDLFKDLAGSYDGKNPKSGDDFHAKFHTAKAAFDDASTRLETTAPAHESAGPESDEAYRARIVSIKPARASLSAGQLRGVSGVDLDSYGVQIGVPRGEAKWNPSAPAEKKIVDKSADDQPKAKAAADEQKKSDDIQYSAAEKREMKDVAV